MIYCDGEKNCQHSCASPQKIRTHEGWNFRWTTPQRSLVKSIIAGPFLRPKLVHASPYVVTSNCKQCATRKTVRERKLRNGIPDPWLEYLAWKDQSSPKDVRCSREYMWLTDHVWNSRGLRMVQGIPDPWREDDFACSCFQIEDEMEDKTTRKKSKGEDSKRASVKRDSKSNKGDETSKRTSVKRDSKGSKGETSRRTSSKRHSKGKSDEKVTSREKKHQRNVYERIKDSMEELDEELRLKEEEMKKSHSSNKATVGSKIKTRKSIDDKRVDEVKKSSTMKKTVQDTSKDENIKGTKRDSKVSFDGMSKRILRCNDEISNIRKDAILAQHKIQKLKEKDALKMKKKEALCTGNCGRVCKPDETLLKSIKLNDEISSPIVTTNSVESVKEFLKEINERIAITKNVLNSADMRSTEKRERGAGDEVVKVIDQRQPSLFSRRCNDISEILIDMSDDDDDDDDDDDNIPDHNDKSVEECYRSTLDSLGMTTRCTTNCGERDSPNTLIVESFSEEE